MSTWIGSRFRVFQLCKDSKGIPRGLHCVSPRSPCLSWWISRPVFMCAKIPQDVLVVQCQPRHPCDARGSVHVIVVYVSSRTSEKRIPTGHNSSRLFSVNIPGLRIILESLKLFLQSPTLEESNFASGTGSTYTGSDSHGIGDG